VSTAATSTTTTIIQRDTAVWPFVTSSTRFSDPVEAARSFAVAYLGFVNPAVGSFMQGDSRSGEVEVNAVSESGAAGPKTTVLVRKLAPDDSWWVLGAVAPDIQLTSPAALAIVSSPVTLSGQSTAFEATVNVEIRQNGTLTPLKTDIVMGGSNGQMGPFSKAISFNRPTAKAGAIVMKVLSAANGTTWEAGVLSVRFS
jgi:hypothetical protein